MLTIQRSFITKAQSSEEEEQLYQIVEQYMPYLAGLLYQLWQNQSKAITYRELKDMLSSGFVPPTLYTDWRQDYQNFVNNNLQSVWDDAIHAAADTYKNKYPDFQFVSSDESIRRWNMEHAAQLITRCTDEQYNALKALVRTATETDGATPDKLARSIRPLIGLNEPQARANQRYYNTLIANDVPREIAEQRRKLYTEQQLQYRAQMIARTELAASYNGGHYLSVLQAQQQGLMGECKRIWRTADTERTCSYCAALDGTEVGMEEDFIFTHGRQTTSVTTPPAHPHCMCTVSYEEIAGFTNEEEDVIIDTQSNNSNNRSQRIVDEEDYLQYKRYRNVLREESPATFEQFVYIKENDQQNWNKLKNYYRIVNRYEIEGEVPILTVIRLDNAAYNTKLSGFSPDNLHGKARKDVKNLSYSGNAAAMLFDETIYFSHSKVSYPNTTIYNAYVGEYPLVGLRHERTFSVKDLGDNIAREYDTEAKFLEFVATQKKKDETFVVTILSEKHICESCQGVVEQFKNAFPNATVNIISGKRGYNEDVNGSKTWKHRKRRKKNG